MELSTIFSNSFDCCCIPFIISCVAILLATVYFTLKNKDLPPGPVGLPLLGYWPFLKAETCHLQLHALKKKYGDVFSFSSAGRLFINLGSVQVLREAHVTKTNCFETRYTGFNLFTYAFSEGLVFASGEGWKALRKFFLTSLKERGMLSNKGSMSDSIYDSIQTLILELSAKKGEPVVVNRLLTPKCNTILKRLCFGNSGVTDEQLEEINRYFGDEAAPMTLTNLLLIGNLARYVILPLTSGYRNMKMNHKKVEYILQEIINDHRNTYDEEFPRDIIDEFFKERDNRKSKDDATAQYFTDKALASSLLQVISDGIISVSIVIGIYIKLLLDHPEDQEKIYAEIMDVVGPHRHPTIEDRSKLTYTNAFILEGLRTLEFFPIFPSLECTKETTLGGYRIPKGAITLLNSWCINYDPEAYEEPEKFNPSRFLTSEAKQRPELPVNFGVGKRSCMGEGYVMMQVFLFLTTLVQNFHLTQPENDSDEELMPGELRVSFRPRSQREHLP